jgi:hypothetical protein
LIRAKSPRTPSRPPPLRAASSPYVGYVMLHAEWDFIYDINTFVNFESGIVPDCPSGMQTHLQVNESLLDDAHVPIILDAKTFNFSDCIVYIHVHTVRTMWSRDLLQ